MQILLEWNTIATQKGEATHRQIPLQSGPRTTNYSDEIRAIRFSLARWHCHGFPGRPTGVPRNILFDLNTPI